MIIASFIRRVWAPIQRKFANATAVRQLEAMTDHQLRDLGISRDQIESVVYGDSPTSAPARARTESGLFSVELAARSVRPLRG